MVKESAMLNKVKMFIWYWKATKNIGGMFWITVLAVIRLPHKHMPGISKSKLLADPSPKLCKKEITMVTDFGTFHGNLSIVANINPVAEGPTVAAIAENIERNKDREPRIFIDVGAHIGRYVIDLAKNYGYLAYGFEPTPKTFKFLEQSIQLSGVESKAWAIPYGLGDKDEVLKFYQSEVLGFNTFCEDQKVLDTTTIWVPVQRFDDTTLGKGMVPQHVALVLIDTEGFEDKVLRGMENLLRRMTDVDVIVEIHETCPNKDYIMDMMGRFGYTARPIDSGNWLFRR